MEDVHKYKGILNFFLTHCLGHVFCSCMDGSTEVHPVEPGKTMSSFEYFQQGKAVAEENQGEEGQDQAEAAHGEDVGAAAQE